MVWEGRKYTTSAVDRVSGEQGTGGTGSKYVELVFVYSKSWATRNFIRWESYASSQCIDRGVMLRLTVERGFSDLYPYSLSM